MCYKPSAVTTVPPTGVVPPPVEPAPAGKGCLKTGLIGCGVAAVVVVAAFVVFVLYVQKKPEVMTDFMMKQVEKSYAPDVTDREKEDLRAAYAAFRKVLQEGEKPPRHPMERIQRTVTFGTSGEVSREQVRELTKVFRDAAGGAPAANPEQEGPASLERTPSPTP